MSNRIERDSMGDVEVPSDRYYGAQTARSLANFPIGGERMPHELIAALAAIKKAAARVNRALGVLEPRLCELICKAADEVLAAESDAQAPLPGSAAIDVDQDFPLVVWQTGSGTHTNMNMNEVLANRANEL